MGHRGKRASKRCIVEAPITGTYHESAVPDAQPFVRVGEDVRVGQTVAIIEAMKVFNEIKAEQGGRVVELPSKSGELVRAGDPLVVLEVPASESEPG